MQLILSEFGAELFRGITPELPPNLTTCNVVMATSLADPQQVRATLEQVAPELDFPVPINFVLDIVEKGWSKLSALPILEEALGVSRDEIVYFGDSENDLTMMRAIPHSFCMGNGTEEAKETARYVIDSDVNDGAAQVMERLAASGGEL